MLGTAHEADTAQLPQSYRPVVASVRHAGWVCGRVAEGVIVIRLADDQPRPVPLVIPHAVDIQVVGSGVGVDLES